MAILVQECFSRISESDNGKWLDQGTRSEEREDTLVAILCRVDMASGA